MEVVERGIPNRAARRWVTSVLKKFPYVMWDRFWYKKHIEEIGVFGWISRENDAYKDYVQLWFNLTTQECGISGTSSAKYGKEIGDKMGEAGYVPCQRVEKHFSLENCIKLKEEEEEPKWKNPQTKLDLSDEPECDCDG